MLVFPKRVPKEICFNICNVFIFKYCFVIGTFFFAKLLDTIQKGGAGMVDNIIKYLILLASLNLVFWIFHGPARVIERNLAFRVAKNFREFYFDRVTSLPMSWHKDNHSGQIIDKIDKAGRALEDFAEHNFMYFETIIRYFGSIIALYLILSYFGFVTFIFSFVILCLIVVFDKYLFKKYRETNEKWHKVGAALYDYIGNISTVITLRIEKLVRKELVRRIDVIYPIRKRTHVVSETKWFLVSLALTAMTLSILSYYCITEFKASGTLLVGTVVMLMQYLHKIEGSFYNLAWQYGQLVRGKSSVYSVNNIEDAYHELVEDKKVYHLKSNWKEVAIKDLSFRYDDLEPEKDDNLKKVSVKLKEIQK